MTTIWGDDTRYPAPSAFELPPHVAGVPTQAELDAQPRLFTWGELKDFISAPAPDTADGRNGRARAPQPQQAAAAHVRGVDAEAARRVGLERCAPVLPGLTLENYLINARLPWGEANRNRRGVQVGPEPTYDQRTALSHPEVDLVPSTRPRGDGVTPKHRRVVSSEAGAGAAAVAAHALGLAPGFAPLSPSLMPSMTPAASTAATAGCSRVATAPSSRASEAGSGASTPSSVAYVSLDSVLPKVNRRLERARRRRERARAVSDASTGSSVEPEDEIDEDDEPDIFLKYDPAAGLDSSKYALLPNDWPYCVPYGVRHYCLWSRVPIAHPVLVDYDRGAWEKIEAEGLGGFTGVIPAFPPTRTQLPTPSPSPDEADKPVGRAGPAAAGEGGWYATDVEYAGAEVRRWAGVEYEAAGGHEVANMVRGLFDPRGFETIWFVNPPRLQSVPGYAHFHIFARRKTPTEIDISEKVWGDKGQKLA